MSNICTKYRNSLLFNVFARLMILNLKPIYPTTTESTMM